MVQSHERKANRKWKEASKVGSRQGRNAVDNIEVLCSLFVSEQLILTGGPLSVRRRRIWFEFSSDQLRDPDSGQCIGERGHGAGPHRAAEAPH
jgi:hypothetical protein